MDVFIGYTKLSDVKELGETLFGWEAIDDTDPAAIDCPPSRFELYRRLAAENLAVGDYILADIGCVPTYKSFVSYAERMLAENPEVGMFLMMPGVHICRKGIIKSWPKKQSQFYIPEHKQAYELAGYQSHICKEAYSRRIRVSS